MMDAIRAVLHGFCAIAGCMFGIAMAAIDPAGPAATEDMPVECVDGVYRFLPGEFNFCVAGRNLQRGRYDSARELLELAAGWGSKKAQFALGLMYFNGDHVAVDHSMGMAWLVLAAERHDPIHEAVLLSAYGKATTAERRRTADLLATMRPVYADAVAARRAQRRFERAMRELTSNEPYSSNTCIVGLTAASVDLKQPGCPPTSFSVEKLDTMAGTYFNGWQGQVSVGPLQPLQSLHEAAGRNETGKPASSMDKPDAAETDDSE